MTQAETQSLTARLRSCISVEHELIEKTPFSISLMSGTLTRDTYALNLAQMRQIHEVLEQKFVQEAELQPFFSPAMQRAEVIVRDLTSLGYDSASLPILPETENILSVIRGEQSASPLSLIGGIYVLEGSRMGSLVLAKPLAKSLQITGKPGSGIDYHIEGAAETPVRFEAGSSNSIKLHLTSRPLRRSNNSLNHS